MINILTRTHRENYFKVLQQSIESQTCKDYNWIVASDLPECTYYPQALKMIKPLAELVNIPQGMYYAPWNHYLDIMQETVTGGWIMYLDDDDTFTNEKSLKRIVNACTDENELVIWKVNLKGKWIVPSHSFGNYVKAGDISGIGFAYHSKHLPVEWGYLSYGDFRVATQLINKGLKPRWIDMVLTKTQTGWHNGKF